MRHFYQCEERVSDELKKRITVPVEKAELKESESELLWAGDQIPGPIPTEDDYIRLWITPAVERMAHEINKIGPVRVGGPPIQFPGGIYNAHLPELGARYLVLHNMRNNMRGFYEFQIDLLVQTIP